MRQPLSHFVDIFLKISFIPLFFLSSSTNAQDLSSNGGRAQYWVEHQGEITMELKELYGEALALGARIEKESGEQYFLNLIDTKSKENTVTKPGVGTAEFTLIDGFPIVRIIHEKTQVSFLMVDKMFFPLDSHHLEQYVARQHVDAGKSRTDGERGRDTVIVWMEDQNIHHTEDRFRPTGLIERMRDYYVATWKATTPSDVAAGGVFAILQGGITMGMMWAKQHLNPSAGPVDMISPTELSIAFGFTIAAFNSAYRNWQERGRSAWVEKKSEDNWEYNGLKNYLKPNSGSTLLDQVKSYDWTPSEILRSKPARQAVISLAYSYSLLFMTSGHSQSMTFTDPMGVLMGAGLFLEAQLKAIPSLFISNIASTWWREPAALRSEMRKNKGPVLDFEIFGRRYQSALKWNTVEGQARYLIPFAFKLPPLLIDSVMNVPGGWTIPWIMQMISIAWGRWVSVRTAEEIDYEGSRRNAAQMREDFENTWYMKNLLRPIGKAGNFCAKKLSGR